MGDLFFNKIAGVVIGAVLAVMGITELGHMLVPSHGAHELTAENTSYPVDWASIESGAGGAAVEEDTGPTDYGALLAAADIASGERAARRCASCHTFEQGGANGVGPNLWGVVGADIASHDGFSYSDALTSLEGNWDFERLSHFIENPSAFAPGTAMSFRGLRDEATRMDLLVYLRSLSDNPLPLPAPLPAADEVVEDVTEMAEDAADAMGDMADEATDTAAEMAPETEDEPNGDQ